MTLIKTKPIITVEVTKKEANIIKEFWELMVSDTFDNYDWQDIMEDLMEAFDGTSEIYQMAIVNTKIL